MSSFKNKQLARFPNLRDSFSSLPAAANSLPFKAGPVVLQRVEIDLSGLVVSMLAANDFGSMKLCDLPATGQIVVMATLDATFVVAGCAVNAGTSVLNALGTAATASTALTGTNENNLIGVLTATGGGTTGTSKKNGASANVLVPAGANAIYLNASSAVTSGTGTLTYGAGSKVVLFLLDVGTFS